MISNSEKYTYRNMVKANSLLGGLQVYQIIIGVIRSKIVAVLLGPEGMGISGLLTSSTLLIKQFTSLGISASAVRDVAEADGSGDSLRIATVITVLRKLVWFTGLLGMVTVVILSPYLSKFSFGNYDYTLPFIILSLTLLIEQINVGQLSLLQGLRKVSHLAKASALGSTLGLLVTIPIYSYFRLNGIVPTLVLYSLITLLCSWYYSRQISVKKVNLNIRETVTNGKSMLSMGISLSLNSTLAALIAYILRGYISNVGGVEEVGLYVAAYAIMETYVGMVFTAIGTDYFPRLAAINNDNEKCFAVMNQQGEIAALVLGPILSICIIFMPVVIWIIYSDSFIGALGYISWASIGLLAKLGAWVVSYLLLAKAETKLFLANEVFAKLYILILNIAGYYFAGLQGLGISFLLGYTLYFIQVLYLSYKRYGFTFKSGFVCIFSIQLLLLIVSFVISISTESFCRYILGCSIVLVSCIHSFVGLEKRIGIFEIIRTRMNR